MSQGIKNSEQTLLNTSFDEENNILAVEGFGYNGTTMQRLTADAMATKITVVTTSTYVGIAAPGTAQSEAKWQVKKIDESDASTTVITWADGNANFDNTATDLTALDFS